MSDNKYIMVDSSELCNCNGLKESLNILLDDIHKMHELIITVQRGLKVTLGIPKVVHVLATVDQRLETDDYNVEMSTAQKSAEIAKTEIDKGFPFLYSQSSIMLYSYLEGAIKRFTICFFKNNEVGKIKELSNIKIVFTEFVSLDENEKFDYLFMQYEKSLTIGMQYGINRFESLLAPLNFSGRVKDSVSKSIFELSQIRNVIIHRTGIADKQFIKSCPWLGYSIGDSIFVTKEKFEEYYAAICNYVLALAIRIGVKNGQDMSEYQDDCG